VERVMARQESGNEENQRQVALILRHYML